MATRVKINEAAQPAAKAEEPAKVLGLCTDGRGRRIRVQKLDALARVDFSDVLGADRIANPNVSGPAAVAFSVCEIDGQPIMQPNSWAEMRALIKRLDTDGIEAAAQSHIDAGWAETEEPGEN